VLHLEIKVVSISAAKGKKLIETSQWKSERASLTDRRGLNAARSSHWFFTLKEGFEFGEMVRHTHESVPAEMLDKVLAYNISQIIRVRRNFYSRNRRGKQRPN
jgi:hypothetical protein